MAEYKVSRHPQNLRISESLILILISRFAYDPMLGDGDYEMMRPLFDLYARQLPTAQALVKSYYKHE